MDLLKTKIYLDKINREFGRMNKDPENILRIDVDIMLSYVRELYDAILSEEEPPAPPAKKEHAKATASRPTDAEAPVATPPPAAPDPYRQNQRRRRTKNRRRKKNRRRLHRLRL